MKILESIVGDGMWAIVKPHIKLDQYAAVRGVLLVMHQLTCSITGTRQLRNFKLLE